MAASGTTHNCALTNAGAALCWGDNLFGQSGDGTTVNRATPAPVSGLSAGVAFITAGRNHTCALTTSGAVKCWGSNGSGELGDGTSTQRTTLIDVPGLSSGVTAIAVGSSSSCAILTGGSLKCWGGNRIGDGTTTVRRVPTDVTGLTSGVMAVAVGVVKCAITAGNGVKCWGINTYGSVGDGTTTDRLVPTDVSGLTNAVTAVSVSGSGAPCAIIADGSVKCWGRNNYGGVGTGSIINALSPVAV